MGVCAGIRKLSVMALLFSSRLQTTTAKVYTSTSSPGVGATSTPAVPTQSTDDVVSVGVGGAVIALIAAAVIVISVTVCLRKRNSKVTNDVMVKSS